nr:hypothetical protein [Tanacetum cinerariifolium]
MASLADKAILSGAKNRPPMLEKDMYGSWRSKMELYMLNRQHGRMILESVENAEAIQADCDVKATNIILQALPLEIYSLVSTHKVAILDRFQKNALDQFQNDALDRFQKDALYQFENDVLDRFQKNALDRFQNDALDRFQHYALDRFQLVELDRLIL